MFGSALLSTNPESTVRLWYNRCLVICTLLVLSLSYAVTNPVILINGGGSEVDPTLMDCSQQTPEYDFETGLTTYRCKPVVKDVVEKVYGADAEDDDETKKYITETMIVKSDSKDKALKSRSSKKKKKNRKNRKSNNTRKSKNFHLYERMISDAPMKDKSMSKMSKNDIKYLNGYNQPQADALTLKSKNYKNEWNRLLKVRKSDAKNHCSSGEVYVSELNICLPHDCKIDYSSIHNQPQTDESTTKSKHYHNNDVKIPSKVGTFEGKSPCGSEEIYISELDICLPHDNRLNYFNIYDRPQADALTDKSIYFMNNVKKPLKVGKFHGKSHCGSEEVYVSELDICLHHVNNIGDTNIIYDQPQADSLTLEPYDPKNENKRALKVSKFEGKSRCGSGEIYVSELDICLPHDNKIVQFSL